MISYDKIKLIIWDLDETFWKGTLSEGEIEPIENNILLVKKLAERGIISTICSKNDFSTAKEKLQELNIWEYFVFNSIDWTPKGQRIAHIITDMSLRSVNVLFVDDNSLNLKEAAFFSPGIMTALPEQCIGELEAKVSSIGKDNKRLSRLNQYKVLEKKKSAREHSASNVDFLKSCHIVIQINKDCKKQIDRISELILRSNQLNYTKDRSSSDDVEAMLNDDRFDCAYITAFDDFGDYGIIGFYALDKTTNTLRHFLFSCRTMGMGIEQFVYFNLHYPILSIVGEVATKLNNTDRPDWITISGTYNHERCSSSDARDCKILFKGPCDTDSSLSFIQISDRFDCEFTFVNHNGLTVSAQNTTFHALQSLTITAAEKNLYKHCNPFWDDSLYQTRMFTGEYNIVFFSLFKEAVSGLYTDKETGFKFVHDDWYIDATDPKQWPRYTNNPLLRISEEQMQMFSERFAYCGRIDPKEIVENIKLIRQKLPNRCLLVISVPTSYKYIDKSNAKKNDRAEYNEKLMALLKREITDQDNIRIIDYTQYVHADDDFLDTSNHFSKRVYYNVAEEYKKIISEWCGESVNSKSRYFVQLYEWRDSIKRFLKKNKPLVKIIRWLKR